MNLFRSEEHVRNWSYYNPEFDKNLQPISYYLERFSGIRARYRGRPDYMSWLETDEAKNARKAILAKQKALQSRK